MTTCPPIPARCTPAATTDTWPCCSSFSEYIDTVKELDHNVLLIFQPAEETLGGAEEICKSGIFTKYNVSQVFGIHLWPPPSEGRDFLTARRSLHAEICRDQRGYQREGGSRNSTVAKAVIDALYITADYVKRTYADHANMFGAIHRFKDGVGDLTYAPCDIPEERTLIHFGKMESGYARNIVSDYSHLLGTVRAYDEDHFQKIIGILTKNLEEIEKEYHCTTGFSHSDGYPPVINDKVLYDEIRPVLESLEGGYEEMPLPLMISEDFSFYSSMPLPCSSFWEQGPASRFTAPASTLKKTCCCPASPCIKHF